jgi:hypothetical protein
MARPQKNNVDYFPHDRDMRDHKKVKAIRLKFGISGYAVWSMLLEYLAGNDGNVFEYSDIEFELMAGDFGVSATEIRDIVDYCIRLEMLFVKDGFVNSESLDERLFPVYQKRGKSKELSKKQQRVNGKFSGINTDSTGVSASEMPQSKVKESKVNESKEENTKTLMSEAKASDLSEVNKPYFEIAKAFFDLFNKNASDLGVTWLHLNKTKCNDFVDPIRLMILTDKRKTDDIRAVWEFLKHDDFWKPNIQTSKKLREKFDQLITKSKTNGNSKTGNGFVEQAHAYFSANDPNYKNL